MQIFEKKIKLKIQFLGTFWKILIKKLRFLGARSASKLLYFIAEGAIRTFLGLVGLKWMS